MSQDQQKEEQKVKPKSKAKKLKVSKLEDAVAPLKDSKGNPVEGLPEVNLSEGTLEPERIHRVMVIGTINDDVEKVKELIKNYDVPENETLDIVIIDEAEIDLIMRRRANQEANINLEAYLNNPINKQAALDIALSIRKHMNTTGFFKLKNMVKKSTWTLQKAKEMVATLELFNLIERDSIGTEELIRVLVTPSEQAGSKLKEIQHHMKFVSTAIKTITDLKPQNEKEAEAIQKILNDAGEKLKSVEMMVAEVPVV